MKTFLYATFACVIATVFSAGCRSEETPDDGSGGSDTHGEGGQAVCRWQYADCNHSTWDGCEVRVSDDDNNCGACGYVCSGAHASMDCDMGECIVDQCAPGYRDADGDAGNGCEATICSALTVGALCGGQLSDAVHGECNSQGICTWQEWTCVHGNFGDKCQGGICSIPWPGYEPSCCSAGCINKDGHCVNIPGTWGGEECP
jgi:hypothetical protein